VAAVATPKANGSARPGGRPAGARKGKGRGGQTARARAALCQACGSENQSNANFCGSCGEPLSGAGNGHGKGSATLACDECGAPVKPGHRFCAGCGAEVSA
jgi:hypothetical protein